MSTTSALLPGCVDGQQQADRELGIRTEKEDVPSYDANLTGHRLQLCRQSSRRALGSPTTLQGRRQVEASTVLGACFYDTMKLELPRGAFGGDVWDEEYYTLDTLDWNIDSALAPTATEAGPIPRSGRLPHPVERPGAARRCGAIDPDLKPIQQQELRRGLDHELSRDMAVSARYVHKQAGPEPSKTSA